MYIDSGRNPTFSEELLEEVLEDFTQASKPTKSIPSPVLTKPVKKPLVSIVKDTVLCCLLRLLRHSVDYKN